VKVLHTADIHLREFNDERWATLVSLLDLAHQKQVDVCVISGDLFDKHINAEQLRPKIRDIFSNNNFPVLIIPGNHDYRLMEDMYFGSDVVLLSDITSPYIIDDVAFYGLPFESMNEDGVISKLQILKQSLNDRYRNILLFHGELLDVMFKQSDIGGEEEKGYMPVRLSFFSGLKVDYVLAGHFHTNFDIRRLPDGGYFVYPGSPVSITRRETGQRKVNIFSVDEPPAEFMLDSPHYEEIIYTLEPLDNNDPVPFIEEIIRSTHPQAKLLITINGYFNKDNFKKTEQELAGQLQELTRNKAEKVDLLFRDIQHIMEDDLYSQFLSRLDEYTADTETHRRIRERVIQAMIEAKK